MTLKKSDLKPGVTYRALSPKGDEIKGTYDKVPGCALADTFKLDDDGALDPEFVGETDMYWDLQRTEEGAGEKLYVCDDGEVWPESELTFAEVRDDS